MENLMTFIPEFLIIVIVATYVVGVFLKKLETVPDKFITSLINAIFDYYSGIIKYYKYSIQSNFRYYC